MSTINLTITLLPLGDDSYLAVTKIGGVVLRGQVAKSEVSAVRALFGDMGSTTGMASSAQTGTDAELALSMALAGKDITAFGTSGALAELPDSTTSTEGD